MDVLNTKIKNIKNEKALKIRPENIKNGVSISAITHLLPSFAFPASWDSTSAA